ncbi:MAG: redox-regulated ATPase YchF [candidate division WOR-3 bacterium]|nr:redox-regulated ATPase YchF [candidate division WOR-3 bacterium]MCX7757528.1 redox-regulated ATPase YchF [candidate division WOR-3 bacterium]MDW7987185.1 redox-regulated ATPase YchF [candidate division WOR-3 bacterium]
MMKIGLVGLPNAGKSSFFNLLTKACAKVDLYPFTTIEKNVAVVSVPDVRLEVIKEIVKPAKVTYATIEVIDIAGLVRGAHEGEGLGNKFLSFIREVDLILHIIRNFEENCVPHIYETVDPLRDIEIVEAELAMADLEIVKRAIEKLSKQQKNAEDLHKLEVLKKIEGYLNQGVFTEKLSASECELLKDFNLFFTKPTIYVFNCSDKCSVDTQLREKFREKPAFFISVSLENNIDGFSEEEKAEIRESLGLFSKGPTGIIEECFTTLHLIRFYTIKGDESRAWAVPRNTNIVDAVRKIHSDMAEGFIKAEVVPFEYLKKCGSFIKAKESGFVRIEGKNYTVQDGDIILVKFTI